MTAIFLQRMVENLPEGVLPANWSDIDLASYSPAKQMWPYQQSALQNALLALWKYYEAPDLDEKERKRSYLQWYLDFGLEENLDIPLDRSSAAKRSLANLLESYFDTDSDGERLPYDQFINRMSFWMATGSGKTLVIVKLIEILFLLMRRGEIPKREILVLAHRDDLLDQLRQHIDEFNRGSGVYIKLQELREYAEVRREIPSLFSEQELTVFYYRSDNLSNEQKEKIIDFRSYDNDGKWYVLLDEAHKGDKEDSKRQFIYSILARNGFLFNFSATFTDPRDIITTISNYNLSEFIRKGHGKHICVLRQEVRAFRKGDDYSDEEKQKIVLKALIMLAYTRQFERRVRQVRAGIYHRPLMMTLVNSVNTEEADLKLFFRELVNIGNQGIEPEIWDSAKKELLAELNDRPEYLFESGSHVQVDQKILSGLTQLDLLSDVFNATTPGEIEVLVRPSNRHEVAFKLKTSDEPFALVRIGDISDWLKSELSGYEVNQRFADEGFFEKLNHPDSDINILLGSRSFYEGWDSNRPNVIMYVNIGVGLDAKKFILQSVGRGVRIEPVKDLRKRLRESYTSGEFTDNSLFERIKNDVVPLESVFVFGTNHEALNLVITQLDQESKQTGEVEISLELNPEVNGRTLLIPTYQISGLLHTKKELAKLMLNPESVSVLTSYLRYMEKSDLVLLALHNATPTQVSTLRQYMNDGKIIANHDARPHRNIDVLMNHALNYFMIQNKEIEGFKELEDEIRHFKQIKVLLEEIGDLEKRIRRVVDTVSSVREAISLFSAGQITQTELMEQFNKPTQEVFYAHNSIVKIRHIANHYYIPVLLSDNEKIDYIRSIIHVPSEVRFIEELEEYLNLNNNLFKKFDWWLFSRIDEKVDDIAIPYYSPYENKIYNFKPDFIFWLQKGNRYYILFVDPKGTSRTEYQHKVDGFRALFEWYNQPKVFKYGDLNVTVHLFLHTTDTAFVADYYRRYWRDNLDQMIKAIIV